MRAVTSTHADPRRVGPLVLMCASAAVAQPAPVPRLLEPVWGAPSHCAAVLGALNQRANEQRVEDLLAAGVLLETSDCVSHNDARASQFYSQAAQRGNAAAGRRLAVLFGSGRGVPQSYANAGAWLTGKGSSDERIEPWDYSIGFAYTLIAATLARIRYPQDAWPEGVSFAIAVEVEARARGRLGWRFTGETGSPGDALTTLLTAAFDTASSAALSRIAPADPRYLVSARVTLPITVRHDRGELFVVAEQEPLLR